jgi:alpha-beta hydrolase superfamily lysophospholipase
MTIGQSKKIGYRQWTCPAPKAVFLLVHGLGAHTGRWEAMAEFFLQRGISSYAVELHRVAGFASYNADILGLREIIKKDNPSARIFLVGESMGALIAFLLARSRPGFFNGLICISPAFANKIKLSMADYLKIAAALFYKPHKLFRVPFDSSMCTRDTGYRKKMDQDPLEHRTASSRLLTAILFAQMRVRFGSPLGSPGLPVLFLVAGEDKMIDHRATNAIFNRLDVKDKTFVEFPGMYHALSIDIGKEAVFEKVFEWVNGRLSRNI